jgi:hypothetical protein
MEGTEETKRMVRRLIGSGRGFAEEWGFRAVNNPSSLFQLLYLSFLLAAPGDHRRAVRAAQALRDRGWDIPARMAQSMQQERAGVLRDAGFGDEADALSSALGDLAQGVVRWYRGDLRRLREQAHHDPAAERQLLKRLAGVTDHIVDLFFREVQAPWREVQPFADERALVAARKLGLGRSADELSTLSGGESEKLAWLVGALARVDLEDRYAEVRELAHA